VGPLEPSPSAARFERGEQLEVRLDLIDKCE
jgi:hypothetical protein